jgi:hypothetical protein
MARFANVIVTVSNGRSTGFMISAMPALNPHPNLQGAAVSKPPFCWVGDLEIVAPWELPLPEGEGRGEGGF